MVIALGFGLFALRILGGPSEVLQQKLTEIQTKVPEWLATHPGSTEIDKLLKELGSLIDKRKFAAAEPVVDRILVLLKEETKEDAMSLNPKGKEGITEAKSIRLAQIPGNAEIIFHQDGYLWTMDRNGARITQLTFGEKKSYEHAAVSSDHRYIVADLDMKEDGFYLWLYDLAKGTEARLVPSFYIAGDGGVDWDRNGFIYFVGRETKEQVHKDLYKVKFDGTGLSRLTNTPGDSECDPAVSEDGMRVSYCVLVPEPLKNSARTEIWAVKTDGTGQAKAYTAGEVFKASAHDPELSPDSQKTIFSMVNSQVPPNFSNNPAANTAHDIWTVNLDGSGLMRITKPGSISIIPDWRGESVVYTEVSEKDGYAGASIVNSNDSEQTPKRIRLGANSSKWIP